MENQVTGSITQFDSTPNPTVLTERHLNEWLQLLDYLQDAHAPTDQLMYCRNQVKRLQLELYQLRNN